MNRRKLLQGILSLGLLKVVSKLPEVEHHPGVLELNCTGEELAEFKAMWEHELRPTRDDVRQFLASERFPHCHTPFHFTRACFACGDRYDCVFDADDLITLDEGDTTFYEFS